MLNFDFIKDIAELSTLYKFCNEVELNQVGNPDFSAISARKALEWIARNIYYLKNVEVKEKTSLFELIDGVPFKEFMGYDKELMKNVHYIRHVGNIAAHTGGLKTGQSFFSLLNIFNVVAATLFKLQVIDELPKFNKMLVPKNVPVHVVPPVVADLSAPVAPADGSDGCPPLKVSEQVVADTTPIVLQPTDLSEAETRRLFIDMMLMEAGWQVMDQEGVVSSLKACIEVKLQGMPNSAEVGFADYVLFGADGKPLAVVEAKRTTKDPKVGRHQAELYADALEKQYGVRPVIYISNGYETQIIDGLGYPVRNVYGFHTAQELELLIQRRGRKEMTDLKINDAISGRDYQKRAIRKVCERLNHMHRRNLLVMATGTGKTRVSISLVDVLCRQGWVKNVLFLADRTALVNQAAKNFAKLLPHQTFCTLSDDKQPDMQARIMFSTYQTMIGKIDSDVKDFSIGRFDLIIVDEAHRSVFGKYMSIFNYFDGFLVGLTATPREEVDRNTFDLFGTDCEDAFAYELDEAVADGFLVPYAAVKRKTRVLTKGIVYDDLSDQEKAVMEPVWKYEKAANKLNPDEEYTRDINNNEIFRYIHNIDTVDKMLQDLMEAGLKVEGGDKLGKTIIFCFNHKHAELVVERFGKLYPEMGPDFCVLIDNYVNYAQDLINRFECRDQMPQVAVSVDMMDTGIDVPDILNLVFFKPVHSRIKFQQMIGRGTRLSAGVFGAGNDKREFYIFDWCNNFEFFSVKKNGIEAKPVPSLSERLFCMAADVASELQQASFQNDPFAKSLHDQLKAELHRQVACLSNAIISVRENWSLVDKYRAKEAWVCLSPLDVLEVKETLSTLIPKSMGDEWAKRFDLLMMAIELSLLDAEKNADRQKNKVVGLAHMLQEKASIPQVLAKMDNINRVVSLQFWQEPTLSHMEEVRNDLRDLIKFLLTDKPDFTVDVEDDITEMGEAEVFVPTTYKQRVIDFLAQHRNLPVLQKIMNIEQLSHADILELERVMWEELGSKQEYERYVKDHNMVCGDCVAAFIRAQVGVDRKVAIARFSDFLSEHALNSEQEDYLRSIINYVCQNGDITTEVIINESPFAELDWADTFGDDLGHVAQFVQDLHQAIIA